MKRRDIWLLVLLVFAGWSTVSFLKYARDRVREMGMSGTVRATAAAIYTELQSDQPNVSKTYCDAFSTRHHTLKLEQHKRLINDLKTRHNLDASYDWERDNVLRDFWGQPLRIIFDKSSNGFCDVEVICAGLDRVFGEGDISSKE